MISMRIEQKKKISKHSIKTASGHIIIHDQNARS